MNYYIISISVVCLLFSGCSTAPDKTETAGNDNSSSFDDFASSLKLYAKARIGDYSTGVLDDKNISRYFQSAKLAPELYPPVRRALFGLIAEKKFDEAIGLLELTVQGNSTNTDAYLDLASLYQFKGDDKNSLKYLDKISSLAPHAASTYTAMSQIHVNKKDIEKAIEALELGLKNSCPKEPLFEFALLQSLIHTKKGAPEDMKAIPWLEFILDNSTSSYSIVIDAVSDILDRNGRQKEAVEYLEKAVDSGNAEPSSYIRLALALADDEPEKAYSVLKDAGKKFPDNLIILSTTGYMDLVHKDYSNAVVNFEKVNTLIAADKNAPPSIQFFINYGHSCVMAGQTRKAEEIFRKCMAVYPDSHEAMNYLAYMWAEASTNLTEAFNLSSNALRFEPGNAAYLDTLGWIYFKQGRLDDALKEIDKAFKIDGKEPTVIEHLGDIYQSKGNKDEALRYWKMSYEIDPSNTNVINKLNNCGIKAVYREKKKEE